VKAAEELQVRLRDLVREYSGARHFIIAHSHGGNVALYALQDEAIASKVSGVITLSTPFLWATLRDVGPIKWDHIMTQFTRLIAGIIALITGMAIGFSVYRFAHYNVMEANRFIGTAFFATCILVFAGARTILGFLWKAHESRVKRLLSSLQYPNIPQSKLLVIRSAADEASLGLALAQIINELISRLWIWVTLGPVMFRRFLMRWRSIRTATAWLLGSAGLACAVLPGLKNIVPEAIAANVFTVGLYIGVAHWLTDALQFLMFAVFVPLASLASLALTPFGHDLARTLWVADISAEVAPPGLWQILEVGTGEPQWDRQPILKTATTLRHSYPYASAYCISVMSDWMKTTR
jgi:hypothetical protein